MNKIDNETNSKTIVREEHVPIKTVTRGTNTHRTNPRTVMGSNMSKISKQQHPNDVNVLYDKETYAKLADKPINLERMSTMARVIICEIRRLDDLVKTLLENHQCHIAILETTFSKFLKMVENQVEAFRKQLLINLDNNRRNYYKQIDTYNNNNMKLCYRYETIITDMKKQYKQKLDCIKIQEKTKDLKPKSADEPNPDLKHSKTISNIFGKLTEDVHSLHKEIEIMFLHEEMNRKSEKKGEDDLNDNTLEPSLDNNYLKSAIKNIQNELSNIIEQYSKEQSIHDKLKIIQIERNNFEKEKVQITLQVDHHLERLSALRKYKILDIPKENGKLLIQKL